MMIACPSRLSGLLLSLLLLLGHQQAALRAQPAADSLVFDLSEYHPQPGLTAQVEGDQLTVLWQGADSTTFRLRFAVEAGVPTLQELAWQQTDTWHIMATGLTPEYRVASGLRRVTQQQTDPLEKLGIPLTEKKLNDIKWAAFWDAPLFVKDEPPRSHTSSVPAAEPFANHPGMPRKPEEVVRAVASYRARRCSVRSQGARLQVMFDGATAGIFSGYLQYDLFKGSNLLRQMLVGKTDHPSAAFKYEAGLRGFAIQPGSRLLWKDLVRQWQDHHFGGRVNARPVVVRSSHRLLAAELPEGALAAFPPPHSFYWARESEQNLGYGWYRKDSADAFSFGIRQADQEEDPEFYQNFALYNARPGTWQRMPLFFFLSPEGGRQAVEGALAFTHGDRFKPLPGYKVFAHHYHVGLVKRLEEQGGFDQRLNDIATMKGVGVDIYSVIDGVRGSARHDRGEAYLQALARYYEAARSQSDKDFLLMPNDENSTGGRPPFMGGHYDILLSRPLFWRPGRAEGQPLVEEHPTYGKVYNLGTPADMMRMTEQEGALISMPHPRAKRSTGYPEAIKDEPHFLHENYLGLGYRWGMGIDASELRLGDYRFLPLWDEANNWMAAQGRPPKFAIAIAETRSDLGQRGKPPYDDTYGMAPVNYLRLDHIPTVDDMSPVIDALKRGDFFVTTGEVLIPSFSLEGSGPERTLVAEVSWTFPLEFVEVVWGDGQHSGREVISTTDLPAFGSKRFEIPVDVRGKKWLRFAAWDVATNGAMVQPVALE